MLESDILNGEKQIRGNVQIQQKPPKRPYGLDLK